MRTSMRSAVLCVVLLAAPALAAEQPANTLTNLQTAFDGESNAHARYVAFAQMADQEGYQQVGRLFRAAARAEQIHAGNHGEVIKSLGSTPKAQIGPIVVKSTRENLETALAGESYERDSMYPGFLAQARKDGDAKAVRTFNLARNAEIEHATLYKEALHLEDMRQPGSAMYVCGVCGYTTKILPVAKCPSSFSPKEKFERID